MEFYIFVIILSIIIFIILKYNSTEKSDYSWYTIFIPILLFSYKFFLKKNTDLIKIDTSNSTSSILMNEPYPLSSSN
jgi:hypothetical protein